MEDLVLSFQIVPGKNPEAESVAQALEAWVEVLHAAAAVVEPGARLSVELVGVEPGSQRFKLALRRCEDQAERVMAGAAEFPLISKAAMTLGGLIGGTLIVVSITNAVTPDPRIPDDQMAVFHEMNRNMAESVELQKKTMKFFGITQDEPAFRSVEVLRDDQVVAYEIPRNEFAERSGVWSGDEGTAEPQVETRRATWDVILIKPVAIPEERRWTFAREGLEFSALMADKRILEAIHDRTLPIQVAEGIAMKIDIQYRERFDGNVWVPITGSHRVKRVLHPLPPAPTTPLFPTTRVPKE